eukprot:6210543-Pleurochrysis_carterae.AAC.3
MERPRERSGYMPSERSKGADRPGSGRVFGAGRVLILPDWCPVSLADGGEGTSGDGGVRTARGGVGRRGAALAT